MMRDNVVEEVRAAREAYAARFGFDLTAIGRDLQMRERASGRVVLAPPSGAAARKQASRQSESFPRDKAACNGADG